VYLLSGWTELVRKVFGHRAYYIESRKPSGELLGVLPVVLQKSLLFGGSLTSGAFFNYGGPLADSDEHAQSLMESARLLAERLECRYLELRDVREQPGRWQTRTDKASLILPLPQDFATLSKQLGSKLRSQVKRADREHPTVEIGGSGLLSDFYAVFCDTMHRLGTPVYPRRFFAAILERFPQESSLLLVYRKGRPVAGAFLIIVNGRAEVPWAGCRQEAKSAGFNMKLYWEALRTAIDRGCSEFDFGRSTVGSGPYQFKLQWGAQPRQLYWHRWERAGWDADPWNSASEGKLVHMATAAWKRLPRVIANTLGPFVSPSLPW
jgi:FemAB-related protein (PEP-CTERM system-associated)